MKTPKIPLDQIDETNVEEALIGACDAFVAGGGILVNTNRPPDILDSADPFGALLGKYMPGDYLVAKRTRLPARFVRIFTSAWTFGKHWRGESYYSTTTPDMQRSDEQIEAMAQRFRTRYPTVHWGPSYERQINEERAARKKKAEPPKKLGKFEKMRVLVKQLHDEALGPYPEEPSEYQQKLNPRVCWDDRRRWFVEEERLKPRLSAQLEMIAGWENTGAKLSERQMIEALTAILAEAKEPFHREAAKRAKASVQAQARRLEEAWDEGVNATIDLGSCPFPPNFERLARDGVGVQDARRYGERATVAERHRDGLK